MEQDQARSRILEAAEELFAGQGYDGVSIREIADRAQANSAMIYYYFGSKLGLYRAIMEDILAALTNVVGSSLSEGKDPVDRITKFANNYIAFLNSRKAARLFLRAVSSEDTQSIEMAVRQYLSWGFAMMEQNIREGVETGVFRPVDTRMATLSLIGMMAFFFMGRPVVSRLPGMADYQTEMEQKLAEHTLGIFLNGLKPRE